MKKIVYLGGLFQAEFSMRKSLIDNNVDIIFLYDDVNGINTIKTQITNNFDFDKYITFIKTTELKTFLKTYNPDVVIHRHYKSDPFMFSNSWKVCKNLGIPFGKLLMETDEKDNTNFDMCFDNCDFLLYAHDTTAIKTWLSNTTAKIRNKCFFYPYGVGSLEYSLPIHKIHNVSGYGYVRGIHSSRVENVKLYLSALEKLNIKLNVYDSKMKTTGMKWDTYVNLNTINISPQYTFEQSTFIMNQTKIAINFESVSKLEGAYSHKLFQTMGCGIPTITYRKKCLENMFGPSEENLIFIETVDEIVHWINFLLSNDVYRNELGKRCELFIHQHYDWFKRLNDILIKLKIWED